MITETTEHRLLRDSVRSVATKFGAGYFLNKARERCDTTELWEAASEHGLVAANIPQKYGGGGGGIIELSIVSEEFAAAGSPLLMIVVSSAICGTVIAEHGTEEQRRRFLPLLASGQDVFAFAMTEPDAGSNSRRITTRADRYNDAYVLNGQKCYITGVDRADRVLVVARTDANDTGSKSSVSLFLVDTDSPGLKLAYIPVSVNAPERQFAIYLDDVVVPVRDMIGGEGGGLRQLFTGLNPERIISAALANGISRYALNRASSYARERSVWGVPIGSHQGLAHPLAECYVAVELARLATGVAAVEFDAGRAAGMASNVAKLAAADAATRSVDQAMQVHGGNGLAQEYELAEFWSLARFLKTAPVSREMVLNYVAEHGLGLPKSY